MWDSFQKRNLYLNVILVSSLETLISDYLPSNDDSIHLNDTAEMLTAATLSHLQDRRHLPGQVESIWDQQTLARVSPAAVATATRWRCLKPSPHLCRFPDIARQQTVLCGLDVVVLNPTHWPSSLLCRFLSHTCERGLDAPAATDTPSC